MTDDLGYCIPNCPICQGYGLLPVSDEDLPITHPDFGKLKPCPNVFKRYWPKEIGISQEEAHKLDPRTLKDTPLIEMSREFIETLIKQRSGMLYIYGPVGIGKTALIKSTLLWAMFKLHVSPAHYTTHASMMDTLRASFGDRNKSDVYNINLKYYSELPVLAIDEVGRDKDSEFSLASFGKIIDHRYNLAKDGKAITLLGSNFKPENILEPYLVDRLRDKRNHVINCQSSSLRQTKIDLVANTDWWKELK